MSKSRLRLCDPGCAPIFAKSWIRHCLHSSPPPPPPPHTHTHTHTVHMALMGYFIVFSFVTKPGQTLEFLLWGTIVPLNFLAGYYCSIVASTPTTYGVRVHTFVHTFDRGPLIVLPLFGQFFSAMSSLVLFTKTKPGTPPQPGTPPKPGTPPQPGTIVPLLLKSPVWMRIQTHTHCTHGTCGVLHCLLFCDQTRPNLRISLVGYHCAIEFPCGVLLFYCCKYPTTYGVRVHTFVHTFDRGPLIVLQLFGQYFSAMSSLVLFTKPNRDSTPTGDSTQTGDSTPTGDYCPSFVKVPGLNTYTNAHTTYSSN